MHHHGADGNCHAGPGGMFGCRRCEALDGEEDETADKITMTHSYDVTGISRDRVYVPIAADVSDAQEAGRIARSFSEGPTWRSVVVKVAATRQLVATWVDGECQPAAQTAPKGTQA